MTRIRTVIPAQTSSPAAHPALLRACRQVEGLFLSRLIEAMDRPVFGGGVLGGSAASETFRAQRNQAIADEMGLRGDLGLADMLYADLSRQTGATCDAGGDTDAD